MDHTVHSQFLNSSEHFVAVFARQHFSALISSDVILQLVIRLLVSLADLTVLFM